MLTWEYKVSTKNNNRNLWPSKGGMWMMKNNYKVDTVRRKCSMIY